MKVERIIERIHIIQCFAEGASIALATEHQSISMAFNKINCDLGELIVDIDQLTGIAGESK
jgi:hypothetical protein